MGYNEIEVDFSSLSDREFEEVCFDLLIRLGFTNIMWRLGSADDGRDIEASYSSINPIAKYDEKWFFECKHYSNGVSPEVLNSKLAWADAKQPDHLVFFVSSHITNNGLSWLEDIKKTKQYRIHYIQGSILSRMISNYDDLVIKYFSTKSIKMMSELKRNWIIFNFKPYKEFLLYLLNHANYSELEPFDIIFILIYICSNPSEISVNSSINEDGRFSIKGIFESIKDDIIPIKMPIIIEENLELEIVSFVGSHYYHDVFEEVISIDVLYDGSKAKYIYAIDHRNNGYEFMIVNNSQFKYFAHSFLSTGKETYNMLSEFIKSKV